MAAHGIVLALYARARTGAGQLVEVSMLDVMAGLLVYNAGIFFATGESPTRRGNQHPTIVPYGTFQAADGWLNVGVANDSLWARYCKAIERHDLADNPRFNTAPKRVEHRDELLPILSEIMAKKTRAEWITRLDAEGIPCGQIRSVGEILTSPHMKARGMIVTLPHPTAGEVTVTGLPIGLSGTPGAIRIAPPLLGQHTDEILSGLLGYSKRKITALRHRGVV